MKLFPRIIIAALDSFRPFFGLVGMVCIYEISCFDYAKQQLNTQPLYKSIPRIVIRVLSCNPITAFFRRKRSKKIVTAGLDHK